MLAMSVLLMSGCTLRVHPIVEAILAPGNHRTRAGESPVPEVCQNAMFFVPLGLALSEKQVPQITENTEK